MVACMRYKACCHSFRPKNEILEEKDQDWMWRVHHAQCPDPASHVLFKIERTGKVKKGNEERGFREPGESRSGRTTDCGYPNASRRQG